MGHVIPCHTGCELCDEEMAVAGDLEWLAKYDEFYDDPR
jgi:hypothetical protein